MASVRCSVAKFGNCSKECGTHQSLKGVEECQSLSSCTKEVAGHLHSLKVNTKDVNFEWQLILARVGQFGIVEDCPAHLTICPKHRSELGLRWNASRACKHPLHSGKSKPERGCSLEMSRNLYAHYNTLVPLGSGICGQCRHKFTSDQKEIPSEVSSSMPAAASAPQKGSSKDQRTETAHEEHPTGSSSQLDPVAGPSHVTESQPSSPMMSEAEHPPSAASSISMDLERDLVSTGGFSSSMDTEGFVSMYLPTPGPPLPKLNNFLTTASDGRISPITYPLNKPLDDCAPSTVRYYKRKASQVTDFILDSIAPGQAAALGQVMSSHPEKEERDMEGTLIKIYEEAETWCSKRQILSIFVNKYTKKRLLELIPGLTKYKIDEARKHAGLVGPGKVVEERSVSRSRLDMKAVDYFIEFISNPMFLQDVAYGTKTLKLSNGEKLEIPGAVRTVISTRLISAYQTHCQDVGIEPLGRSTLFSILQHCSASQKSAVSGLDNVVAEGLDGFDTLESVVTNMYIQGHVNKEWKDTVLDRLRAAKRYLKTDYVLHLAQASPIADHCIPYALSADEGPFTSTCDHPHDSSCDRCINIQEVLTEVKATLSSPDSTDRTDTEEMAFDVQRAAESIDKWKSHIVRAVQQEQAKTSLLDRLQPNQALITMDWAMKFLPLHFRETQEEWFGKKGKSWHVSAVTTRNSKGEFEVCCYVHIFEQATQDWFAVASIIENTLNTLKRTQPVLTEVYLRSDNAGCYHCAPLLLSLPNISKRTGLHIVRYDYSEAQKGKDICDRKIAVMKAHIRRYVNEGHNVVSAKDMKDAMDSYNGVPGCHAAVVEVNVAKKSTAKPSWPGIQSLTNFQFSADGKICVWKAYSIGPGKSYKGKQIPAFKQDKTDLLVHSDFPREAEGVQSKKRKFTSHEPKEVEETETQNKPQFGCPTPNCTKEYTTLRGLEQHLDSGRHLYRFQEDSTPDYVKKKWAKVCTSLTSRTVIKETDEACSKHDMQATLQSKGWALRGTRKTVRFTSNVKEYLLRVFWDGEESGQKADPADVARQIKRNKRCFEKEEWLTAQQIKSHFSRLSALNKAGKLERRAEVSENDDSEETAAQIADYERYNLRKQIQAGVDL